MTKKILLSALVAMVLMNESFAQDSTAPAPAPALKISGSVDAYYRYSPGAQGSITQVLPILIIHFN
jgi:hypothetical protein